MKDGKSYAISQSQLVEIETARKKNRNKNIERRLYVLVMRAEGKSLEEISEKTGYHISTISRKLFIVLFNVSADGPNIYIEKLAVISRVTNTFPSHGIPSIPDLICISSTAISLFKIFWRSSLDVVKSLANYIAS